MEECVWVYWVDEGNYTSECGEEFYFGDGGTLEDNIGFKYCPYCGKLAKDNYDSPYDSLIPDKEGE